LVDELRWIGRTGSDGYQLSHALLYVALQVPSHLYELLPITVLIGTIFVMARLAQSSEFTILRTSGMGPWLACARCSHWAWLLCAADLRCG
jgi:lipopolysaccharide export system permease protein